jgi:D-threo-aldose 1-dehydrogenase
VDPLVRRRLGRTDVEVTQLGLGGAGLGDLFDVVEDADASATLQAAWDAGIRYYDTSPWYGRGQSEHRFGRALYRHPRADYVLSTKVGRLFRAFHDAENFEHGFWRGGLKFQHRFDYSYDGVMRSFEDSLQRLGLPRIDLLLIHDLDISHHATDARVTAYLTELHNGGFRALTELRQAGLISGIGAGVNEVGMMPRFLDLMDIDFFLVALPSPTCWTANFHAASRTMWVSSSVRHSPRASSPPVRCPVRVTAMPMPRRKYWRRCGGSRLSALATGCRCPLPHCSFRSVTRRWRR